MMRAVFAFATLTFDAAEGLAIKLDHQAGQSDVNAGTTTERVDKLRRYIAEGTFLDNIEAGRELNRNANIGLKDTIKEGKQIDKVKVAKAWQFDLGKLRDDIVREAETSVNSGAGTTDFSRANKFS